MASAGRRSSCTQNLAGAHAERARGRGIGLGGEHGEALAGGGSALPVAQALLQGAEHRERLGVLRVEAVRLAALLQRDDAVLQAVEHDARVEQQRSDQRGRIRVGGLEEVEGAHRARPVAARLVQARQPLQGRDVAGTGTGGDGRLQVLHGAIGVGELVLEQGAEAEVRLRLAERLGVVFGGSAVGPRPLPRASPASRAHRRARTARRGGRASRAARGRAGPGRGAGRSAARRPSGRRRGAGRGRRRRPGPPAWSPGAPGAR